MMNEERMIADNMISDVEAAAATAAPSLDGAAWDDRAGAAGRAETAPAGTPDPENAPISDWSSVDIGLPEGSFDAEVLSDFGATAVELGLTPKQARELARWQTERIARSREELLQNGVRELTREWGSRTESNRQAVLSLISRIDRLTGDDGFSRALGESGAACFPGVARGLLALSRLLEEDSIGAGGAAAQAVQDESAIDGLKNAFRESRRRGR